MQAEFSAGTVLYAKDLASLSQFYATLLAWPVVERDIDFVLLQSAQVQLAIVAMPAAIAAQVVIATPPVRREDTPIKPCFAVPDLQAARECARQMGGAVYEPVREWVFQGYRVCDGYDPEGNIFQLRAAGLAVNP